MSNQIRNFYFANKEAPILWILTKSQLILIIIFWWIPWIWFFFNIQLWANFIITFISFVLTILWAWIGYIITSVKIDWRSVFKYLVDKKRDKISKKSRRFNINKTDVWALINKIKQ